MPCVAEVVNRSIKADCTDFSGSRAITDKYLKLGRVVEKASRDGN